MDKLDTSLQAIIDRISADYELQTGEQVADNVVVEALIAAYSAAGHSIYRYISNRIEELPKSDENSNRFGTDADYAFWANQHNNVDNVYCLGCTPYPGDVTVSLVVDDNFKDDQLFEIQSDIQTKVSDIAKVFVKKSATTYVTLEIKNVADVTNRQNITNELQTLFVTSNQSQNAIVTIAQIHDAIANTTNDYNLISPNKNIAAEFDNHLKLGKIKWS